MNPLDFQAMFEGRLGLEVNVLRALIDAVPDPIFCKDVERRFLIVNRSRWESMGLTEADFLGKTVFDVPGLSKNAAVYDEEDRRLIATGTPSVNHEEPFVRPDGSAGWYLTSKFPLRDAEGRIVGLVGIARDITDRKENEKRIAEERRILQAVLDVIPDPLFLKDREGRHVLQNRANRELFGLSDEACIGKTVFDLPMPLKIAAAYSKDDVHVMTTGEPVVNREEPYELAGEKAGWFLTSKFPMMDSDGHVIGLVGVCRDITQMKRAQADLERARQRLLDHIENSPLAVIEWRADFSVERWGGQAETIFGWSAEEVLGKRFADWNFVLEEDMDNVRQAARSLLDGSVQRRSSQSRNLTKSGAVVHCVWQNSVLRDAAGNVESILSLVQDVSERVRAEEAACAADAARLALERKLQEAQKLESLGVLAGGIAHDFNNLLTSILGNASLAAAELPKDSMIQPLIEQIEQGAVRAADLCRQMLAYSGKGRFLVKRLNLNTVIEETMNLLRLSVSKSATLQVNPAPHLPAVRADSTQIQQIVMNLVINSSEACAEHGGSVVVRTGTMRADRRYFSKTYLAPELPEGEYVFFEVADNGSGMTPEVLARVFDPFFTTKFTGRGLGLAAVLGIVRGHGGALRVMSTPGEGTTFRVLLPFADGAEEAEIASAQKTPEWRGQGTVLLVDDEETVRSTVSRLLGAIGFQTVRASDGVDGVAKFAAEPDRFQLVVLDLTMPGMDGDAALREMRVIRPSLRVLLISGYNEQEVAARFAGQQVGGFLQKPFTLDALRGKLQSIVAG